MDQVIWRNQVTFYIPDAESSEERDLSGRSRFRGFSRRWVQRCLEVREERTSVLLILSTSLERRYRYSVKYTMNFNTYDNKQRSAQPICKIHLHDFFGVKKSFFGLKKHFFWGGDPPPKKKHILTPKILFYPKKVPFLPQKSRFRHVDFRHTFFTMVWSPQIPLFDWYSFCAHSNFRASIARHCDDLWPSPPCFLFHPLSDGQVLTTKQLLQLFSNSFGICPIKYTMWFQLQPW